MMKIEIWSDFACPFCYIGKTRFEKALKQFKHADQVEVSYKAYQLNPHAPVTMTGTAIENFSKSHQLSLADTEARFKKISESAAQEGLNFRFDIMQMTKTFDAHRLAKWAQKFQLESEFTTRAMKAYFIDGLNIADHETLAFIAQGIGLDSDVARAILKSNQYANQVLQQQAEARQIGIESVPFFVLNQKYAISGAQTEAYFLQVLNHLWSEAETEGPKSKTSTTEYCDDEGCHLE